MAGHDDRHLVSCHGGARGARGIYAARHFRQFAISHDFPVRYASRRTLGARNKRRLRTHVYINVRKPHSLPGEIPRQPARQVPKRTTIFHAARAQSCLRRHKRLRARLHRQSRTDEPAFSRGKPDPSATTVEYEVTGHRVPSQIDVHDIIRQPPADRARFQIAPDQGQAISFALSAFRACRLAPEPLY